MRPTTGVQVVAVNGAAEEVSVVQRDAGLLERGKHVRRLGVNVVVADFFDAGGCGATRIHDAQLWHQACELSIYIAAVRQP